MTQSSIPALDPSTTPPPTPAIPPDTAYNLLYQDGMFLTSGEMTLAQNYFVNWLQLQNSLLYTPGVLSGLVVSNPSGNILNATAGAGIDSAGHFVIVADGAGNTVTVQASAANPSYVGLTYPVKPQPVAGLPYTVNMAGILSVANSIEQLPADSLVLAQITMTDQGGIASIQDMRTPVTSRLPAVLGTPAANAATLASSFPHRSGVAAVPGATLRKQGDSVLHKVQYLPQGGDAFDRTPHVVVTVRGDMPFATSVDRVMPDGFTLKLTAVLAPASDRIDDIMVNWFAYV